MWWQSPGCLHQVHRANKEVADARLIVPLLPSLSLMRVYETCSDEPLREATVIRVLDLQVKDQPAPWLIAVLKLTGLERPGQRVVMLFWSLPWLICGWAVFLLALSDKEFRCWVQARFHAECGFYVTLGCYSNIKPWCFYVFFLFREKAAVSSAASIWAFTHWESYRIVEGSAIKDWFEVVNGSVVIHTLHAH